MQTPQLETCAWNAWNIGAEPETINDSDAMSSVSMEDVAKALGINRTTVSRALKNDPRISPETRERVARAAEKLGYRLNPLISALMVQRAGRRSGTDLGTIAYVSNMPLEAQSRHKVLQELLEGATARADELGYKVEQFQIRKGMTHKRLTTVLQARGIVGVCVPPLNHERGHMSLGWKEFAASTIGYSLIGPVLHRAAHNHYHGIQLAFRELRRLGYRSFGLCLDSAVSSRVDDGWLAGFLVAKQRFPQHKYTLLLEKNLTHEIFYSWFDKHQPEVIISDNWGFEAAISNMGLRAPQDVGFVTLGWDRKAPHQSGINQNSALIAKAAIDLVINQMQRNERGVPEAPRTVLIEGSWFAGETVRKVR